MRKGLGSEGRIAGSSKTRASGKWARVDRRSGSVFLGCGSSLAEVLWQEGVDGEGGAVLERRRVSEGG